ncbi:MAG: DUF2878 domain-containing protein [Desulfobacterota bacterium]|jgi:hypothetical protein|nr:DUF2878 domain-containing protein [Thermodesulfobacteriota bacterium]
MAALRKIINFLGFQAVWLSAVFGAAAGQTWLGPVVAVIWLGLYSWLTGRPKLEIQIALTALMLGLTIDTLLIGAGAYTPQGVIGGWPVTPPWMLALWVNFGTLVNGGLSWLQGRYLLGAVLGAWGGPLAYYSGQRLGALTFHPPLVFHLAVLGAAWAVAVPLLFFLAEKFQGRPAPPPGRVRSGTDYRSRPSSPC